MPAQTRRRPAAAVASSSNPSSTPIAPPSSSPARRQNAELDKDINMEPARGLRFAEPLSWRAGKPIPVGELLRRLQTLAKEMKEMNQEEEIRDSFTKVAKELANPHLLDHKDKGVRAWTAHCLVDILRLCAPDAPYTAIQLTDIFTLLITHVLPALSDPTHAYNNQHMYVLNSLATVKSIVLVVDLPPAESLVTHLFTSFFDMMSGSAKSSTGEPLGKNVELNLTAILVMVVDEAASLPPAAVDAIMAQFLRTDPRPASVLSKSKKREQPNLVDEKQTTLVLKDLPPAYNMAKVICNTCAEKMAREVSQYFVEIIEDVTSEGKARNGLRESIGSDDMDLLPSGPTEDDILELDKAHKLLRELWRASPAVLSNVIPQLEAELGAENVQLRKFATETLGDIASGIGAAGPPPAVILDPAAYPQSGMSTAAEKHLNQNILTIPASPQPFLQVHQHSYETFLTRRHDKAPSIRAAWATGAGRILTTSAGGVGLGQEEERVLVDALAKLLNDPDERVRLAAIRSIGGFTLRNVVRRLGSTGSVDSSGSVLANLAERVKDKKSVVRNEAMRVLARIWGCAVGEMLDGNEEVIELLKGAPSKILNAYYANDNEIGIFLDHVMFEILLPLSYPPIKAKSGKNVNGDSQRVRDSQTNDDINPEEQDPDRIRAQRILLLAKYLDEKAKKVFMMIQARQAKLVNYIKAFLQTSEEYNTGIVDKSQEKATLSDRLTKLINELAKFYPDASKVSSDLWKFAKTNDRRSFQLIRFCMAPESDFRTLYKAFKELSKRIEASPNPGTILESLTPLLYRSSIIIYNKSHIPAIMEYSRSDDEPIAHVAQELLQDISSQNPEVLKGHVQGICKALQDDAPSEKHTNSSSALDGLKACASFAKRFPNEIPQDRKFVQAMTSYALLGSPAATAKHAVSVIMAASEEKEKLAKDIVHKCVKGFSYGKPGFLSRLAALSQLWLLAPTEIDDDGDAVIDIAVQDILLQTRSPADGDPEAYEWSDAVDPECEAKCWALKILVNRLRSHRKTSDLAVVAKPIFVVLDTLIAKDGEITNTPSTPSTHKSQLRLLAARLYLKLSISKSHEALLTPHAFNKLAEVVQDGLPQVRTRFVSRLRKYLSLGKIPPRFYTMIFLLAYEPDKRFKTDMAVWIRSRVIAFKNLSLSMSDGNPSKGSANGETKNASRAQTIFESVFSRLISLLAHHPDYPASADESFADFARYFLFYLDTVAGEENISLIYHITQRVKSCQDAVLTSTLEAAQKTSSKDTPGANLLRVDSDQLEEANTRLYALSDLAQLAIRAYEDTHNWVIQTLPTLATITLPRSLFKVIKDHEEALHVAERNYLSEDLDTLRSEIERMMRRKSSSSAARKRKSEVEDGERGGKKAKKMVIREVKPRVMATTKKKAAMSGEAKRRKQADKWDSDAEENDEDPEPKAKVVSEDQANRRRSGRVSAVETGKSYAERDDSEDDQEMEDLNRGIDNAEDEDEEEREGPEEQGNGDQNKASNAEEVVADKVDFEPAADEDEAEEPTPTPSPPPSRRPPPKTRAPPAKKPLAQSRTNPKAKAITKPKDKSTPTKGTRASTRTTRRTAVEETESPDGDE
ncbi:hypothetical protein MMC25_001058 [Agyrium rufum]|nr:hypothetical protein [Agyrium rufum]